MNSNQNRLPHHPDYQSIIAKVERGLKRGLIKILFVDIDATLILGTGYSLPEIETSHRNCRQLITRLNQDNVIIIPVTGGHYHHDTSSTASIVSRIKKGFLPRTGNSTSGELFFVDAYVSEGGAHSIYSDNKGNVLYDEAYRKQVHPESVDYQGLLDVTNRISRFLDTSFPISSYHLEKIIEYDDHAEPFRIFQQPGTEDGTHRLSNKICYHFYAGQITERDIIYTYFKNVMSQYGFEVVCCEEKDANTLARRKFSVEADHNDFPLKYCLDIGPFNKGSAVEYFSRYIRSLISEKHCNASTRVEVWGCGDSGNDLPLMMSSSVTHAIIVGGASAELLRMKPELISSGKSVYTEKDPFCFGPASILKALGTSQK